MSILLKSSLRMWQMAFPTFEKSIRSMLPDLYRLLSPLALVWTPTSSALDSVVTLSEGPRCRNVQDNTPGSYKLLYGCIELVEITFLQSFNKHWTFFNDAFLTDLLQEYAQNQILRNVTECVCMHSIVCLT